MIAHDLDGAMGLAPDQVLSLPQKILPHHSPILPGDNDLGGLWHGRDSKWIDME